MEPLIIGLPVSNTVIPGSIYTARGSFLTGNYFEKNAKLTLLRLFFEINIFDPKAVEEKLGSSSS
jgi:hypothetical protein